MKNIIQRAFELAESGECLNTLELQKKLKAEGFSAVEDHLAGGGIKRQLRGMFIAAADTRRKAGV